jgi:glycosyltransferase involved in cell wall biosynthesis
LKLHLVSEHASPLALLGGVDAGGQNVHVADLALALARAGVEVVVHTRRDDPRLARRVRLGPGVVVDHVDAGPPEPLPKDELLPHMRAFAADLRRSWERERPDVVHSHFWMSGLATLDAARPLGIPVLHTYHALGVVKRRYQGASDTSPPERLGCEQRIAIGVDRVVATTEHERRELITMGADPDAVRVVPCGVDLTRFKPRSPRLRRRRGRPRVVVVSRLVERKGIGNVIEAIAELDDIELVIAGGPPASRLDVDSEARRFRSLARRVGVADRVRLVGAVPRERVPALLQSADVVACCPWYEPFGMVAVEAMACGVPVVASATGGLAETVVDGVTGALVTPRCPASIADGIRRALAAPWWGEMGAARAERYGWDRVAAATLAVADEVTRQRRRLGERAADATPAGRGAPR